MNSKPIIFSVPMVNAILNGQKTQTRRVIKPQPDNRPNSHMRFYPNDPAKKRKHYGSEEHMKRGLPVDFSPYGQPGDQLWVRETWDFRAWSTRSHPHSVMVSYAADGQQKLFEAPSEWNPTIYREQHWRPSIHMPRWVSRISLDVIKVRVQRVQDISRDEAKAEGVSNIWEWDETKNAKNPEHFRRAVLNPYVANYSVLWDELNGPRGFGWDVNPYVWAIEFKVVTK